MVPWGVQGSFQKARAQLASTASPASPPHQASQGTKAPVEKGRVLNGARCLGSGRPAQLSPCPQPAELAGWNLALGRTLGTQGRAGQGRPGPRLLQANLGLAGCCGERKGRRWSPLLFSIHLLVDTLTGRTKLASRVPPRPWVRAAVSPPADRGTGRHASGHLPAPGPLALVSHCGPAGLCCVLGFR